MRVSAIAGCMEVDHEIADLLRRSLHGRQAATNGEVMTLALILIASVTFMLTSAIASVGARSVTAERRRGQSRR